MGTVLHLASQTAVDQAWERLCDHRRPLLANPRLILNREFVQTDIRLHAEFTRLLMALDHREKVRAAERAE